MSREDDEKEIEATKAPLMEHLIELRSRLIKALIAFAIAFVGCFFFAKTIYNVLTWPFVWIAGPENSKFIYTEGSIWSVRWVEKKAAADKAKDTASAAAISGKAI
jgi:hypothetical protein